MKTRFNRTAAVAALYVTLLALPAMGAVIYDNIPSPQPVNVPSVGFEATSTAEFGDLISFAGTDRTLHSVTALMSTWAPAPSSGAGASWSHDLTFSLYNVGTGGAVGTAIDSRTQTFDIPWRPAADPTCADPTYWRDGGGVCRGGIAFAVTFDFTGVIVPDQIIYGLSFNTADFGVEPIHAVGPYNSLNFGLNVVPPSVGIRPSPDTAYWNTSYGPFYTDGGAGGVGTFRQDTGWTPYGGAVSFDAVPEPATCLLFGTGLLCIGLVRRRRSKNAR